MSEPSQTPFWNHLRPYLALLFLVGLLISQLLQAPPSVAATPQHYRDLEFPPLPDVELPEYERFQLDNGLKVYLMEDHRLPLVSGVSLIQTGSRLEPADKVGLASLTGALMRAGGTLSHPPNVLNQQLEQNAASVEASIGNSNGSVSFEALSPDLQRVFDLFVEVLREPAFDTQQLALLKNQARGNISRRNDQPNNIANREFQKLIYGEESPYARTMEYATLDAIEPEDIQGFYEQSVQPDRLILGLVGDFDSRQMKRLIEDKLGDWQASGSSLGNPASALSDISQAETEGVFLVDSPRVNSKLCRTGSSGGPS